MSISPAKSAASISLTHSPLPPAPTPAPPAPSPVVVEAPAPPPVELVPVLDPAVPPAAEIAPLVPPVVVGGLPEQLLFAAQAASSLGLSKETQATTPMLTMNASHAPDRVKTDCPTTSIIAPCW